MAKRWKARRLLAAAMHGGETVARIGSKQLDISLDIDRAMASLERRLEEVPSHAWPPLPVEAVAILTKHFTPDELDRMKQAIKEAPPGKLMTETDFRLDPPPPPPPPPAPHRDLAAEVRFLAAGIQKDGPMAEVHVLERPAARDFLAEGPPQGIASTRAMAATLLSDRALELLAKCRTLHDDLARAQSANRSQEASLARLRGQVASLSRRNGLQESFIGAARERIAELEATVAHQAAALADDIPIEPEPVERQEQPPMFVTGRDLRNADREKQGLGAGVGETKYGWPTHED